MNASHGSLDERSVPEDSQSKQGEGSVQITGNNQGKVREFIQFSGGRDEVLSKDVRDQLRLDISNNKEGIRERLQNLTSEEVFSVFDIDDSGLISYEEFRRLLPFLGIYMNDAKAYRFFRLCDMDDSGQIDVDEFKVSHKNYRHQLKLMESMSYQRSFSFSAIPLPAIKWDTCPRSSCLLWMLSSCSMKTNRMIWMRMSSPMLWNI